MATGNWYPDSEKVAMARALRAISQEHDFALDPAMESIVERTLRSMASATADAARRRERELARQAAISAVFGSDEDVKTLSADKLLCEASVSGVWHSKVCGRTAKVKRTWTDKVWDGLYLDGVKVERDAENRDVVNGEWVMGRGFVKRELTDEERERCERRWTTITHTAFLCGTHRIKKGSFGLPY